MRPASPWPPAPTRSPARPAPWPPTTTGSNRRGRRARDTKATLSIDADDKSKDYGEPDPPFTYELSGFVNGEDEQSAGVTGEADCSREAGESVAASPYEITCTAGTLAADHYGFETGEAGELTINKADPDCTVTGYSGAYDGDPHGASGSCAGVNDEGPLAGLDLGQSFTNVPGGTANWSFTDQSGNYSNDDGSVAIEISKADPDCTVTGYSGTYDGDPHGASGSCAGVNDEGPLAGLDLGQSFTNVPGGTANWSFTDQSGNYSNDDGSVAIEISKADPDCTVTGYSGAYDGDPHGASGSCAGVNDEGPLAGLDLGQSFTNVPGGTANWSFTDQSGNYSNDDGSVEIEINRATLSIDADDKSKDYGEPDPPFTYELSGFVNGEDEQSAGVTGEADCSREAGESVAASPYEITCTAGTLAADNYGFETGEAGELEITKATLSIDADDKSKDYGEPDPPFTYKLSGFVNGEDEQSAGVTGEADCSREAGESVAASPYEITCTAGTLAADNYGFETGEAGELEITKATLSIDADDKSKDYGEPDPPFTYKLSGFVNGEDEQSAGVTGEADCSREAGESVAASPYEITCTAGTLAADHYGFETGEAGELTINKADPDCTVTGYCGRL